MVSKGTCFFKALAQTAGHLHEISHDPAVALEAQAQKLEVLCDDGRRALGEVHGEADLIRSEIAYMPADHSLRTVGSAYGYAATYSNKHEAQCLEPSVWGRAQANH